MWIPGASPGFKNQELAVVGGGDTALEEALYLTKYGKHIHLLVRANAMRASKTMQASFLGHLGASYCNCASGAFMFLPSGIISAVICSSGFGRSQL